MYFCLALFLSAALVNSGIASASDEERVAALEAKYRNIGRSLQNVCNSILKSTNGDYSCCANPDTAKVFCVETPFATGLGLSSTLCTADADVCSDTEATSPGRDILSRIEVLKTKAANVGVSLASMCGPIDLVVGTATPSYDCCANPENSQTRCVERAFSAGLVSQGSLGVCLSSDLLCSTDNGDLPQDDLATLETKAMNAADSLGSTCGPIEIMANGGLDCCANPENGQMACIEPAFGAGLISGGTMGVCYSTDALCNQEECLDIWPTRKCEKKLQKDKCGREKVARNCQKTCDLCGTV